MSLWALNIWYIYIYLNISCKYINIRNLNITERRSKMATTFNNSRDSMYRTRMYCLNEFPNKLFPLWLSCFPLTIREPTSVTMECLLWSPDVTVSFAFVILLKIPAYEHQLPFCSSTGSNVFLSFARTPSSRILEIKINREIINTLLQLWI